MFQSRPTPSSEKSKFTDQSAANVCCLPYPAHTRRFTSYTINTELIEQKNITPGAAEHRGNKNVGVSTCTIVGIHRFVCVCVCVCVCMRARV